MLLSMHAPRQHVGLCVLTVVCYFRGKSQAVLQLYLIKVCNDM